MNLAIKQNQTEESQDESKFMKHYGNLQNMIYWQSFGRIDDGK
jgi:hypothetical protein